MKFAKDLTELLFWLTMLAMTLMVVSCQFVTALNGIYTLLDSHGAIEKAGYFTEDSSGIKPALGASYTLPGVVSWSYLITSQAVRGNIYRDHYLNAECNFVKNWECSVAIGRVPKLE